MQVGALQEHLASGCATHGRMDLGRHRILDPVYVSEVLLPEMSPQMEDSSFISSGTL